MEAQLLSDLTAPFSRPKNFENVYHKSPPLIQIERLSFAKLQMAEVEVLVCIPCLL